MVIGAIAVRMIRTDRPIISSHHGGAVIKCSIRYGRAGPIF